MSVDYKEFEVSVKVRQTELGEIFTKHLISEKDQVVAHSLRSRGEEQIAFALLQEAFKREMHLQLILRGESFQEELKNSSEEEKIKLLEKLCQDVQNQMSSVIEKLTKEHAIIYLNSL